ncbi:hypothetical protein GPECTOR_11g332 [Gonium pectorale]|uniref:Uncharacterized protein n=1 Tax=Gonium pectorale TaxID=33097 RepID=A0A150GPZ0_GONPE|nr:hypothetical protein GPECTOR_11g332 [Gonium pectorale]|eukprot:KXZ51899.1 hypothetical protein GPECTOR_11g332 [Gonium pectorale]
MNAYSGEFVRNLVWIPGSDEIAFAAASVVVLMSVSEGPAVPAASPGAEERPSARQRHLLGHTAYVCALAASSNGQLLASAQEGKEAIVRLWDVGSCACLSILNANGSGLSCVDISPDMRAVAAVGLDAHGRQSIALWNIAELRGPQGKVELVTRHATEYNIKVLRFSAYQEDHLMTAGRDSIRIYRLKNGQLRGTSVRLVPREKRVTSYTGGVSAALGPNIFTDIAFEAGVGVYGVDAFKVYVSTASGAVFQVDYTTRSLDAVFQLHSAAINCLLIADGLAITGGDDRLLRAWPLDFRDFLLEEQQQHRAAVVELVFSPLGDRLYSGGADGALVVYDVQRLYAPTQYLSAGVRDIKVCVAVSSNGMYFASLNRDPYRGVTSILVFHGDTLEPYMRIETDAAAYIRLAFSPDCKELWALTAGRRLDRYELTDGYLVQQVHEVSSMDVTAMTLDPTGRYVLTAGNDGLLRLVGNGGISAACI